MPSNTNQRTSALPSPPPSADTNTAATDIETLTTRLDALLALHLHLLNTYTTLRTKLSTQFSSGFLSLAAANRNAAATLGPGRRFGEEGFDGRMKASRVVKVEEPGMNRRKRSQKKAAKKTDQEEPSLLDTEIRLRDGLRMEDESTAATASTATTASVDTAESEDEADVFDAQPTVLSQLQQLNITAPEDPELALALEPLHSTTTLLPLREKPTFSIDDSPQQTKPRSPLNWYTALPPPALRQTQSHFSASLPTIASLVTVTRLLEGIEAGVRAVRAELRGMGWKTEVDEGEEGMERAQQFGDHPSNDDHDEAAPIVEEAVREDEDDEEEGPVTTDPRSTPNRSDKSVSSASPLKGQITSSSRGSEPRSRLLKMR